MMRRHPGERGLALDDWAGLLVDGDRYHVVAPDDRPGSVRGADFVADRSGRPGLWVIESDGVTASRELAPRDGDVTDLLRPASTIEPEPRLGAARVENPIPPA